LNLAGTYFLAEQVGHLSQVVLASAQHCMPQSAFFSVHLPQQLAQPEKSATVPTSATMVRNCFISRLGFVGFGEIGSAVILTAQN